MSHHVALKSVVVMFTLGGFSSAETSKGNVVFERDVRPIMKRHCFHCHGELGERNGGLDLRLVRLMQAGGDSEVSILGTSLADSLLWQRIAADEMPEGPKKLSDAEKKIVRRWISQGARTARPEPQNVEDAKFTVEELSHWAFQPVARPRVPAVGQRCENGLDAFVAKRHETHDLRFSRAADRRTLIRRLSFDLTGLPPTPEDVEHFLADTSENAYERLVDRLLASPQFGVRWGRHWLDVAGYAESNGGDGGDSKREQAWRYRDYVVDAFNQGKPIDLFFVEQLAGDELVGPDVDIANPRHLELLSATGFLRMAPDATQNQNTLANRNLAVADSLKVISSSLIGLTVGCAQCHDHKYDPIGIDDYYRFRAIFDPVFPLDEWRQPNSQTYDFTNDPVLQEEQRIEQQAKSLEEDLNRRRNELAKKIQELKLADVPEDNRDATRTAVLESPSKRTEEQKRLLDLYPMVKPISNIIGLLVEYDMPAYRKFEKELAKIAELRATKPPRRIAWTTRERPDIVPASFVFFRGNPESRREAVAPNDLYVLRRHRPDALIPENDSAIPTTGRRLAYARELTNGQHPLTARVFVNRIWQHYMGHGIVRTPSDFGTLGREPTHPQLLDWLASCLVESNWDQKRIHRLIVMSRTYRQATTRTPALDQIDPENEFYARMSLRRLEAEAIRDAILLASDSLDVQLGGASIPVTEDPEGKVVIGKRKVRDGLKAEVDGTRSDANRRSIFVEVRRTLPLNVLSTFDQPAMTPNCDIRAASTVATQSLWFLNDSFMVENATRVADTILASNDDKTAIRRVYAKLFAVEPSDAEMADCLAFLNTQARGEMAGNQRRQAMSALCQILMASNRFLYVD